MGSELKDQPGFATARSREADDARFLLGARYIRGCLEGAVRKGHDPYEILEAAGLNRSVYDDPSSTIDGIELQRLFVTILNVMNDAYLGFMDVKGKLRASFIVCLAAANSETFGEALKSMAGIINAFRSDIHLSCRLDRGTNEVELRMTVSGLIEGVEPHLVYWLQTHWFYKFLCWLVGQRIRLNRVRFQSTCGSPESVDFTLLYNCPIEVGEGYGALYFDQEYLKLPVIRTEAELRGGDLVDRYSDWFDIPGSEQALARRVEQLLMDMYEEGRHTPTLQVLADVLCASPRTISRRLQKESTTFQEIKDRVRRELADRLLLTTELPISVIAERVGFWEPADFSRAYVRWTGVTPSEFRIHHNL